MRLTEIFRPGILVASEEGVNARGKVWADISETVMSGAPEVDRILSSDFELS
jgi:hypothetical protein